MFLLDTNVVSELRKLRPHGAVVNWFEGLREEEIFISAPTLGELQAGIEKTRHQDEGKAEEIEAWADKVAASMQVLPMDGNCFREWARLMDGQPDEIIEDGMLAATARVHGLTVSTRNVRRFTLFDVPVFNPFL